MFHASGRAFTVGQGLEGRWHIRLFRTSSGRARANTWTWPPDARLCSKRFFETTVRTFDPSPGPRGWRRLADTQNRNHGPMPGRRSREPRTVAGKNGLGLSADRATPKGPGWRTIRAMTTARRFVVRPAAQLDRWRQEATGVATSDAPHESLRTPSPTRAGRHRA